MIDLDNKVSMFATFVVVVLDLATGRLDYCNAGHVAPFSWGDRERPSG